MSSNNVDVLISARKRMERTIVLRTRCTGRAGAHSIEQTTSSSFACDLKKWLQIMEVYEGGGTPITRPCRPMRSPGFAM